MKTETQFQKDLKDEIRTRFPDSTVLKNDPNQIQGFPDLLVLVGKLWALLEVKKSKDAPHRPNQDRYVEKFGSSGFASFVYPENKDEVLNEMEKYFDEN